MTWKNVAKKSNSLPPGWSTADEIAADLDCEPSEVGKILSAAVRNGSVEKQTFPHWQEGSRQLLYQTGYRQVSANKPAAIAAKPPAATPSKALTSISGIPPHLLERVRQTCLRYAGHSASHIADRCRWNGEPRIYTPAIRTLLDKLSL